MRHLLSPIRVLTIRRHDMLGSPLQLDSQTTLDTALLLHAALATRRDFLVGEHRVEVHAMLEAARCVEPFFADGALRVGDGRLLASG